MLGIQQTSYGNQQLIDSEKRTLFIWRDAIFEYRKHLFITNCKTDEEKTSKDRIEEENRQRVVDKMLRRLEKGLPKDILFSELYGFSFFRYSADYPDFDEQYKTNYKTDTEYKISIAWLYSFKENKVINLFFDVSGITDGEDFFLKQPKRKFKNIKCPACGKMCALEIEEPADRNHKKSFFNISCSCRQDPVKEYAILKATRDIRDLAKDIAKNRRYIRIIRLLHFLRKKFTKNYN